MRAGGFNLPDEGRGTMISCGDKSFVEVVDVDDAQGKCARRRRRRRRLQRRLDGFEEEADREECNLLSLGEMPEQEWFNAVDSTDIIAYSL